MDADTLTALAEPSRLRIVELLATRPHTVGEVAAALGMRQPQVSKHLGTLSRAGLVTVHPLGQRRVCALERTRLRELRDWLDGLAQDEPQQAVLEQYRRAVDAETAAAAADPAWAEGRTLRFTRSLAAPPETVWSHWTTPGAPGLVGTRRLRRRRRRHRAARRAAPRASSSPRATARPSPQPGTSPPPPRPGRSTSRCRRSARDGDPLFTAAYAVRLEPDPDGTRLELELRVLSSTPAAAPAVAGLRPGWEGSLDRLARALS